MEIKFSIHNPAMNSTFLSDINSIIISTMKVVSSKTYLADLIPMLRELQDKYPLDLPHPNPRNQDKKVREKRMFSLD